MACRISGLHGGDYEECRLLRCYAVWLLQNGCFGGLRSFHLQDGKNSRARNVSSN
jgi:hypothetical protein